MAGFFSKWFGKRESSHPYCAAVVPAAGNSTRMGGENKMLMLLDDVPVLVHTLRALDLSPWIQEIVVATREEDLVRIAQLCRDAGLQKPTKVVRGGETRTESVLLAAMETSADTEYIAVHDGARPLVSQAVIEAAVIKAMETGAAVAAVPAKDTMKLVVNGQIRETLPREQVYHMQTPQVFDASLLKAALQAAVTAHAALTDDASAVERLGKAVAVTEGSYENLKITTPEDVAMAEAILKERE